MSGKCEKSSNELISNSFHLKEYRFMFGNTMVNIVGMQNRCGSIFAQVANASCVLEDLQKEERKSGKHSGNKAKLSRLHAAHALSMDVVLGIGLEMGSHSGDCWRHVYRSVLQFQPRVISFGSILCLPKKATYN